MTPIDPVTHATADPRSPMAPPYIDEDPTLALVEEGLDVAENEARDAVADDYEASALDSDDPDAELDDIDFAASDDEDGAPEIAAIHEGTVEYEDELGEDELAEDQEPS